MTIHNKATVNVSALFGKTQSVSQTTNKNDRVRQNGKSCLKIGIFLYICFQKTKKKEMNGKIKRIKNR